MNWKLRFKNKATFLALAASVIGFVYQVLGICGITVSVAQDTVTQLIGLVVNILVAVGVVVDPTTPGITDSKKGYGICRARTDIKSGLYRTRRPGR